MTTTNTYSPNGSRANTGTNGFTAPKTGSSPKEGRVVDIVLRMHRDLVDYGRKRAESSRDVNANDSDLRSLEEHAESMANEAYRERYDPVNNEEHKLRESEYQKARDERPEAELLVQYAQADVVRLEEEMSRAQSTFKSPKPPQVLMIAAVSGLALTIAPTLHDYVFITMKDDLLNWAISLLSASIYGVFITWGLLDSDDVGGRRTIRNWLGLAGGIGIPVGLGILRVANAVGTPEILFALALTIIEIGIVVLLESRATTLRLAYQEWSAQQAVIRDITTRLEAARLHLATCKQKLTSIIELIESHISLVEELSLRNLNIDKIKADAVKAVRDGYFDGIASNRGYLRGVRRVA